MHLRQPHPPRLRRSVQRHGYRPAHPGRRRTPRAHQHGRVRDGILHRILLLRPLPQSGRPRPHPGRQLRRIGGSRRRRPGSLCPRHRNRRLCPPPGLLLRYLRPQAHLRHPEPLGRSRIRLLPGPGRPSCQNGRRHCARPFSHGRQGQPRRHERRARLLLARDSRTARPQRH